MLSSSITSFAADEVNNQQHSVYKADFFAVYTPQNALDMVQRIPGFSFDQGSNERGFGGNAGNVLIDGARPTSKSGGLSGALNRIPAAQVDYIEILRGGVGAGEAAGQAVVANIVLLKEGSSGTWKAELNQVDGANIEGIVKASLSSKLGSWDTSVELDVGRYPGYREALIEEQDVDGVLISSKDEVFIHANDWRFFNGEGSREYDSGKLKLNTRIGKDKFSGDFEREKYLNRLPDDSLIDGAEVTNDNGVTDILEFGGDWTTTGKDWKWRLIGLGQTNDHDFESLFEQQNLEEEPVVGQFRLSNIESEYILRTTFSQLGGSKLKPEVGLEVAKNKLDTKRKLIINGEEISLNNGEIVIEELRSELFANGVYNVNPKLVLEGGITFEFSQIELSGDSDNKQIFRFYKPRLSAIYQLDKAQSLTVEAERRVSQLNFRDFAASTDTNDGNTTSGNSNLRPFKTSELAFTYDWNFSERGSLNVRTYHEWRSDVLEQIILAEAVEATDTTEAIPASHGLGNAGDARFWGINAELNLPLDGFLENGLLEINRGYRNSSFDDPVTEQNRSISWYTPNYLNVSLRQDVIDSKFTWGMSYYSDFIDAGYRVDEKQTFGGNERFRVFIETTRYWGVKMLFQINNINTAEFTRTRYIYNDTDRSGNFVKSERSSRTRKPELRFSISGTF